MLILPAHAQIFLCKEPISMRKSFEGLSARKICVIEVLNRYFFEPKLSGILSMRTGAAGLEPAEPEGEGFTVGLKATCCNAIQCITI